jgi:hypothetical protein
MLALGELSARRSETFLAFKWPMAKRALLLLSSSWSLSAGFVFG